MDRMLAPYKWSLNILIATLVAGCSIAGLFVSKITEKTTKWFSRKNGGEMRYG